MFEQLPPNLPTPKDAEDIFAKVDTGGTPKNLRDSSCAPLVEEKAGFRVSPKPFIIGGVVLVVAALAVAVVWSLVSRTPKKPSSTTTPATNSQPVEPRTVPQAPSPVPRPRTQTPPSPTPAPAVVAEPEPEPVDTDGDGLVDSIEVGLGTNIRAIDTDGDELFDKEEVQTYGTDPRNPDTDGDGYSDGQEVKNGYDPKGPGRLLELP